MTPSAPSPAEQASSPLTSRQKWARSAVIVAVLVVVAMWIYAFGFASKDAVAKLNDSSWAQRAAKICEARNVKLADNATAERAASDGSAKSLGAAVDNATVIITQALEEVLAVKPTGTTDRELVDEFERLYRVYLGDRRAATDKLLNGEMAELNETLEEGAPVSKIIADFTSVNRMDSCQVPPQF